MENEMIWFVALNINAVFRLDVNKQCVFFVTLIPVKNYNDRFFGNIIKRGNKLFLVPFSCDEILVYDINEADFTRIDCKLKGGLKFGGWLCDEASIYLIGRENPLIAKYDIQSNDLRYIDQFKNEEVCAKTTKAGIWSRGTACICEDSILIPNYNNSCILDYRLNADTYVFRDMGMEKSGFGDIVRVNDICWLIPVSGECVVCWNPKDNQMDYVGGGSGFKATGYMHAYIWNNNIVIVDFYNLDTYIIDTEKRIIESFNLRDKLSVQVDEKKQLAVRWAELHDSKLYLNLEDRNALIQYDFEADCISEISMDLEQQSQMIYMDEIKRERGCFTEKIPFVSLTALCDYSDWMMDESVKKE